MHLYKHVHKHKHKDVQKYKFHSTSCYIGQTASVKFRMVSPKTATQCLLEVCTHRTQRAPDSERDKKKQNKLETKASFLLDNAYRQDLASVWSRNRCRKQRPNRCIGDAIHYQTDAKLTKKCGSKFGSVVAPSDATDKNRNIAQLQSILYTTAEKRFWKIYFLYDFWCAQTCTFRAVFGLPIRNLTLAVSAM